MIETINQGDPNEAELEASSWLMSDVDRDQMTPPPNGFP